ncbi:hypothetical protein FSP39_001539 [Pinctada imbricata]|uniref:Uncharacterized protein n=1 Tax=Pinctada imbricata TaxID=66713 RepID=A0AA89C0E5_PINIB|nr:hypothetical protein FSP39_001539 [Pinctada imbricata]
MFKSFPPKTGVRKTNVQNVMLKQCIFEEIEDLLKKSAIEIVPKHQIGQGFYSTFFVVPKKDGGLRPILNLRPLNRHLHVPHFKMETLRTIISALEIGDWVASIDLKDAYLHIAIYPQDRKYLRFCVGNQHYQFRSMPFGLATAPRVFTKLMTAIDAFLRTRQIHIFMYLDDWLLKGINQMSLIHNLTQTLTLLIDLGLVVNMSKSSLIPTQQITYLGACFSLIHGTVTPTSERFLNLSSTLSFMIQEHYVPARLFLRALGLMAACIDLVPWARLHMRPIQLYLLGQWRPHIDNIDKMIQIKTVVTPHLQWWMNQENIFQGSPLQNFKGEVTLWTDASAWGWGAHLNNNHVSGKWENSTQLQHINILELTAVENALHHFKSSVQGKQVLLRTDNSTVVSYINRQGGTKSPFLCMLTWRILQWCRKWQVLMHAAHIPGKKNVLADQLSRGQSRIKLTEWSLNLEVTEKIFNIFSPPNIDLFATRENRKLQVFCSPQPDPQAWSCDALATNWTGMYAYAFPPPVLVPKVLKKAAQETCVLLLIAPMSPKQSWYPDLLELLIDFPRKLPIMENLLTQKRGQIMHPDPGSLNLAAWKISKDKILRESFLKKLNYSSQIQDGHRQEKFMMLDSKSIKAGAIQGNWIHIRPL